MIKTRDHQRFLFLPLDQVNQPQYRQADEAGENKELNVANLLDHDAGKPAKNFGNNSIMEESSAYCVAE